MENIDKIETANAEEYEKSVKALSDEVRQQAEDSTVFASPVIKTAVKDSSDELCSEMERFQKSEKEHVPSPQTWTAFFKENRNVIRKALHDLGTLVGKEAKNAEENISQRAEVIFEATEKAVSVLQQGTAFFKTERERLILEEKELETAQERISMHIADLQKLADQEDMPAEAKEALNMMQKDAMETLAAFQSIRKYVKEQKGRSVPFRTAKLYEAAKKTIHAYRQDLEVCAAVKRAAIKEKAHEAFSFIAGTAKRLTAKAHSYLFSLKKAAEKVYSKGKELGTKLQHMRPVFSIGFVDNRDSLQKYLKEAADGQRRSSDSFAACFAKAMLKDGIPPDDVKKSLKDVQSSLHSVEKDKALFQDNVLETSR